MMDDLISRQFAIKELESGKDKKAKGEIGGFYNQIIENDIEKLKKLPPAQPEPVTNCHDLISKRDTYLALVEKGQASKRYKLGETWELNGKEIREVLDALPSAQPEIIHCKDCRWWDKFGDYDNGYCMAAKHGYFSKHWEISIKRTYKGDFYCADAEL